MNRDHIKIVEFGMDDSSPAISTSPNSGGIKVIEYDNDRKDSVRRTVNGKDVGKIKIIEFDDDHTVQKPKAPAAPSIKVGPVKVVEFDKEQDARASPAGAARIKILEFD